MTLPDFDDQVHWTGLEDSEAELVRGSLFSRTVRNAPPGDVPDTALPSPVGGRSRPGTRPCGTAGPHTAPRA